MIDVSVLQVVFILTIIYSIIMLFVEWRKSKARSYVQIALYVVLFVLGGIYLLV